MTYLHVGYGEGASSGRPGVTSSVFSVLIRNDTKLLLVCWTIWVFRLYLWIP